MEKPFEIKIKPQELLKNLKEDYKAAKAKRSILDAKIDKWKREYNGEPYGNENKRRSQLVSRDIKKQAEWQHAALIEPFVSTPDIVQANPVTFEDAEKAPKIELLLNTQFCRQFNRYNFMTKVIKVLDQEGTCIIRTGWELEEKTVEELVDVEQPNPQYIQAIEQIKAMSAGGADEQSLHDAMQMIHQIPQTIIVKERQFNRIPVKNHPTAMVCRNSDVFIDPTCGDNFDEAQFIIYRYETTLSVLRSQNKYKNLDKVARDLANDEDYKYRGEESDFKFQDTPRKKIVVYEYWGYYDIDDDGIVEPIVCSWINDTLIQLDKNPFPDEKPPFIITPFSPIPFSLYGESNAELLSDVQKIKTAIYRGFIDNMALSNNGQKGVRFGVLDTVNKRKFLEGENFEFNGTPNDFFDGSFNELPASIFNVLQLMNNEAESITGVASYNAGINGNALGSMLDIQTIIPMLDGSKKLLKDINDGDIILGSNGKGTTVTKAHEIQFPKQAYILKFSNGEEVKGGGEHLWTVKVSRPHRRKLEKWHTVDGDTLYEYIKQGYHVFIPKINRPDMQGQLTSTIDPYCLGAWLGDGNSHGARITTEDIEIVERFKQAGHKMSLQSNQKSGKALSYEITAVTREDLLYNNYIPEDSFHTQLKSLKLLARYGGEKHIPKEYFTAPYEVKLELLRGLMDTDGYIHGDSPSAVFTQTEGRLVEDFKELLISMGISFTYRIRSKEYMNKIKENSKSLPIKSNRNSIEIFFTPLDNPFYISRKASRWKAPTDKINMVKVISVEKCEKTLMRCLTVDSLDKLYAFGNYLTLTHNTATGVRSAVDSASTRRLNTVRNISENLVKPLLRKWLAYSAVFLDEEAQFRITNEEFVWLKREDLGANVDIDLTISTSDDNQAKASELAFMLQTIGPHEDPEVRKMMVVKIARLYRMPELAKQLENYQPQPDPMQQELMRLQIELLAAQVENERNKAGENAVDQSLKQAKTQTELAKAKSLEAQADKIDLDYIQQYHGVDKDRELEAKRLEQQYQLTRDLIKYGANMKKQNL